MGLGVGKIREFVESNVLPRLAGFYLSKSLICRFGLNDTGARPIISSLLGHFLVSCNDFSLDAHLYALTE